MNILDIGIIILILFGGIIGFKRGFTTSVVHAVGMIVVLIAAYLTKDILSQLMYDNLPFLKFGLFKNIEVLNILFYEFIAFLLLFTGFSLVLKLVLAVTSVFEKILNATIILGIPSKLLGAVVGLIHYYVVVFIILVLTLGFIELESDVAYNITKTPILADIFNESVIVVNDFKKLKDNYSNESISEKDFNCQAINLFLEYGILTEDSLKKLNDNGKVEYTANSCMSN